MFVLEMDTTSSLAWILGIVGGAVFPVFVVREIMLEVQRVVDVSKAELDVESL